MADRTYSFVHNREYEGGSAAYGDFALGLGLDAMFALPVGRGLGVAERGLAAQAAKAGAEAAGPVLGPARTTDLMIETWQGLGPGRQSHVRTVGPVDEMRQLFDAWTVGAERLPARGTKIPDVYELPDKGTVQWRTGSGSGGPAIEISTGSPF